MSDNSLPPTPSIRKAQAVRREMFGKRLMSEAQRKAWADPVIRAKRLAGIRRFHAERQM